MQSNREDRIPRYAIRSPNTLLQPSCPRFHLEDQCLSPGASLLSRPVRTGGSCPAPSSPRRQPSLALTFPLFTGLSLSSLHGIKSLGFPPAHQNQPRIFYIPCRVCLLAHRRQPTVVPFRSTNTWSIAGGWRGWGYCRHYFASPGRSSTLVSMPSPKRQPRPSCVCEASSNSPSWGDSSRWNLSNSPFRTAVANHRRNLSSHSEHLRV